MEWTPPRRQTTGADMGTNAEGAGGVDPIAARAQLAERIGRQVRRRGYFLADLDQDQARAQALADLRWAAQVAGRALDRAMRTYVEGVGYHVPGAATFTAVVAPAPEGTNAPVVCLGGTHVEIDSLLREHWGVPVTRPA